jgi:hypothetical protein
MACCWKRSFVGAAGPLGIRHSKARAVCSPDSEGNVKRSDVYDANDNIVMTYSATFDDLRQVATITNGHKKSSTIVHDLVGNLADVIGPGPLAINMGYDALGRAKTFTQTDAGTITADNDIADPHGRA